MLGSGFWLCVEKVGGPVGSVGKIDRGREGEVGVGLVGFGWVVVRSGEGTNGGWRTMCVGLRVGRKGALGRCRLGMTDGEGNRMA